MVRRHTLDKPFLIITILLVAVGIFVFTSASFGLLTREGASFARVAFNQLVLGLAGGGVGAFFAFKLNYKYFQKIGLPIFIFGLALTGLVFVPGLGLESGGAFRWLDLGFISFQPAEVLKFGFVLFAASWFAKFKNQIGEFKYGLLALVLMLGAAGGLLLTQPNTATFAVIFATGLAIYLLSGGSWKHLLILLILAVVAFGLLIYFRPYLTERIASFIDPSKDPLGSSYQIRQSLVAVGSGGIFGRGFGQSIQKFEYLPEPVGDSIFAVLAEEFGFIGSALVVLLFVLFTLRGLKIAKRAPDEFSRLAVAGIVIMIAAQSLLNIGAILGILPLTGVPLLFISHGGTALFFTLVEVGLVLNISRYQRQV